MSDQNERMIFGRRGGPFADPSPEEIAERAAEIRAEWDEREEWSRRVQKCADFVSIPRLASIRDHS